MKTIKCHFVPAAVGHSYYCCFAAVVCALAVVEVRIIVAFVVLCFLEVVQLVARPKREYPREVLFSAPLVSALVLLVTILYPPQCGAVDAEIKDPSVENTELKCSPFKALSRSV